MHAARLPTRLLALAFALVAAGTVAGQPGSEPPRRRPALDRSVTFVQEVGCRSESGRGFLADVEVRIAVPASSDRQRIDALAFDPEPEALRTDRYGNRIAVFRRPRVAGGEILRFGWTCRALTWEVVHEPRREPLAALAGLPAGIRADFLEDGDKYGLGDPGLRAAADEASRGATDALDLAFRVNELVRRRLSYVNDGRWDAAARVLGNGHGSCSEYGFLFTALCRLNGLPARYVGATALRSDGAVYEDTVHHRWSEVYLPGHGWFPVDVSRNDGEEGEPVNGCFGRTAAGLLVLVKGDGGAGEPLGWGYVSAVDARAEGDASLLRPKRFVWREPVDDVAAAAPRAEETARPAEPAAAAGRLAASHPGAPAAPAAGH